MESMSTFFSILSALLITACNGLNVEVVLDQVLFEGGDEGEVYAYRIPVATLTDEGKVVVYAEGRKYSRSDSNSKFVAGRSSVNGGYSWSVTEFVTSNFKSNDGINLGAVLYNSEQSEVLLFYTECAHRTCASRVTSNFMIKSVDGGLSWEEPVDIGKIDGINSNLYNYSWSAGPGYGIQKKLQPNKGRLIVCGHTIRHIYYAMECITSDDQGKTWKLGASQVALPKYGPMYSRAFWPTEVQISELKNGSILFNVRNERKYFCACRIIMLSNDGGDTIDFNSVRFDTTLIDPTDAGGILKHGDLMFFSNAANAGARENITLRWSANEGQSWDGAVNIYPGPAAYSTLTSVDENHIGVLYERSMKGNSDAGSIWFTLVKIH
ncbi:sialidase-1-like [Antedon mediterranea]|uniref:sialidase-1-like n=1 Tax=Antedon mediterranea TaxID=105859 RepID=UPI003AF710F8